ncbi:uncharacterized protein LOC106668568 [Cimex lectularius]|uniref:Uncharacterized protein n=1 Tax=Cimex lectularius TaxID=79782 RepID=A0A8I6RY14_CIMLE|nr:uncharacterized protein LOC106668568 [Cimex lectularius]
MLCGNSVNLPGGLPTALNTIFGIVLMGRICEVSSNTACSLFVKETNENSFADLQKLDSTVHVNPLELQCEDHFAKTHTRDDSERYAVSLPFKENTLILGESKPSALVRFRKLEHRFEKEPSLKENYDTVMRDYLPKGYISRASLPGQYFLSHHEVIKDSTSTKLRVLFDASFATSHGYLNDKLLTGPKLQRDIKEVLLHFHTFQITMTADIAQMYLQIVVSPHDHTFQHFLYSADPSEAVTASFMHKYKSDLQQR